MAQPVGIAPLSSATASPTKLSSLDDGLLLEIFYHCIKSCTEPSELKKFIKLSEVSKRFYSLINDKQTYYALIFQKLEIPRKILMRIFPNKLPEDISTPAWCYKVDKLFSYYHNRPNQDKFFRLLQRAPDRVIKAFKTLDFSTLSKNSLKTEKTFEFFKKIAVILSLTNLNFEYCTFINDQALEWISQNCRRIEVINLSRCKNISYSGLETFLRRTPTLKQVQIGGDNNEALTSARVAPLLQEFPTILTLRAPTTEEDET